MKRKLLSLLMVLSMILCGITPVFAAETSEGDLLAQNVRAFTYQAGTYGVDIIFTVPDEAPTETKVTLYNTANNTVVTGLAAGKGLGEAAKQMDGSANPATFISGDCITPGKRVAVTFNGLSSTGNYYAEIEMKKGTEKSGTVTVSDITPTGYAAQFDGYSFGRLVVSPKIWDASHALSETAIDTENVYSGKSSLKYSSEGFCRGGAIGSRADLQTQIWINNINFSSTYYEWKFAYKGNAPKSYTCGNGTVTPISSVKDGDWTIVTNIIQATSTSISPQMNMGNEIGTLTYIDAMSIKKVESYDANTKEYTITDKTNYLKGGGFETQVSDLKMDTEKVLTWTLPDTAYFAKLTIKKDNEVIGTLTRDSFGGITATSYTIPDDKWDKNSTYSVTAATAGGASHLYHNPTEGKAGEPVEFLPEMSIGALSLDNTAGKATASVNVRNNKIEDGVKAVLIIAEYDADTRFVQCATVSTTVSKDQNETLTTELNLNNSGNTVTAFLWDGLDTIIPLSASISE